MKVTLRKSLLNFLVERGYSYFLSTTNCTIKHSPEVSILLKPVTKMPNRNEFTAGYDTYFNMMHEPQVMAKGINGVKVWVDLTEDELIRYWCVLMKVSIEKYYN